jgi:hypothetical protein
LKICENLSDSDIGEVKSSAETFASVMDDTAGLKAILDVRQGLRWLGLEDFGTRNLHPSILAIFDGTHGIRESSSRKTASAITTMERSPRSRSPCREVAGEECRNSAARTS